jgi:ABC-type uncharacterized transport system fused permease/ATPase subunit
MFYISVTAMICNKCEQLDTEIKLEIESNSKTKGELNESERINALRVQMIDIINYYRNTFDILIVFWLTESLFGALITLNSIYCLVLNENMQIIDIISYYYHFCAQTFTGLIIFVAFNCVKVSLKRFQKPI